MTSQHIVAIGNRSFLIEADGDFSVGNIKKGIYQRQRQGPPIHMGRPQKRPRKTVVAIRDFELNKTQIYCTISPAGENRRSSRNKPKPRLCVIFLAVLLALSLKQSALWGLAT